MILPLTALVLQQAAGGLFTKTPAWTSVPWEDPDPLRGAWIPYASELRHVSGYDLSGGWPERSKRLIGQLPPNPSVRQLYNAAATYLLARDLDWRYDFDPTVSIEHQREGSSSTYNRLVRALMAYRPAKVSREFCRVAFAVCSTNPGFSAGNLRERLLKAFPDDRLVVLGAAWYESTRMDGAKIDRATWMLTQAKRLPHLEGFRPHDYVTLAHAYGVRHWSSKSVEDAKGYRDALLAFKRTAPPEYGKYADKSLREVEAYLKRQPK